MTLILIAKMLAAVVFGAIGVAFILFHPAGPALVLTAISPFDGLFIVFGNAGNIVTFIPIAALLVRTPARRWIEVFASTPIQVAFIFLLGILSISHLIAIDTIGFVALIQWAQKITVLLVMSVFAWSMRNARHLELMNRVLVVSMAIYITASLLDFYLGIHSLPGAQDTYGGAIGLSAEESLVHDLRFAAGGLSINATGNWLLTPIFMAFGWFTAPGRKARSTAFACLTICVIGLLATMSRSSVLGLVVGVLLILPYLSRLRPAQVVFTAFSAVVIIGVGLMVLEEVGFLDAFLGRFFPEWNATRAAGEETARTTVFVAALRVWLSSPIFGVGDGTTSMNPHGIGFGAHNSFLGVLAEAGVVGLIPYVVLMGMIVYRLARRLPGDAHPVYRHWRPFFLAAFVSSMTMSMFNEYSWERMTWYAAAFAVALQAGSAAPQQDDEAGATPKLPDSSLDGHIHPALRVANAGNGAESSTDSDPGDSA